jgi:hypothetical protein
MMAIPLMDDLLTVPEKAALMNLTHHPGYAILIKLMSAACVRATEEAIKLDPADDDYDRKLPYLQQRSRIMNEFSVWILKSVKFHAETMASQAGEEEEFQRLQARLKQVEQGTTEEDNIERLKTMLVEAGK